MDGTQFIVLAERDAVVIEALKRSLEVMRLTHGTRIDMVGIAGVLNYKKEMIQIVNALMLLGIDPETPPFPASKGARSR